jgi:hypothetical protein
MLPEFVEDCNEILDSKFVACLFKIRLKIHVAIVHLLNNLLKV